MIDVTTFLFGVAAGIGMHRILMGIILDQAPDTLCAYCEWLGRKKDRHRK